MATTSAAVETFYFYDLETSGFSPSAARIMQFAGQRTDLELKAIGEPDNFLISLSSDTLPDPDAILVTGITPQKTIEEGLTEYEFLKIFTAKIATPSTIFVGFNSIRFDDEFMRYLHYRNLYDPYEWAWKEHRSRWDMLDLVRMTRALRPNGIKWPLSSDGKPANRLELLTSLNKIEHNGAHDALSDVRATLGLARLIRAKQPKLFDFLLNMRTKTKIATLVKSGKPFVYTSGKYQSEFEKTTVVATITDHPKRPGALVFDLRYDPNQYAKFTPAQLVEAWHWHPEGYNGPSLPVKTLQFNRCPAVAPLSVLDNTSQVRLGLDLALIQKHHQALKAQKDFVKNLLLAVDIMDKQQQAELFADAREVDAQLYDGFLDDKDRPVLEKIRLSAPDEVVEVGQQLKDQRLQQLLPLYKARNFRSNLSDEERSAWEKFCQDQLLGGGEQSRIAQYFKRIEELRSLPATTQKQHLLLTDLELYGQSLLPSQ